jgi:Ca-activated chloride channel family protein
MLSLSFHTPLMLFLLVIPFGLLVWTWTRNSRRVTLPLDHSNARRGRPLRIMIGLAESLIPLLMAVVIFILAGPQRFSEPQTKRSLTNIEFCVDISGSMTAAFGDGNRYDASMKAINQFLDFRQGDAFGLTFFGNNYLHWVPLTTDTTAFRCATPFMRPESVPPWFGGTEIGKALMACYKVLTAREEGDRMIVLVSDGYSSDLSDGSDMEIAQKMRGANIKVFAIHIADTTIPDSIVNITAATGGEVFDPADTESLAAVFQQIDALQQTKLEKVQTETMDDFWGYCVVGLSCLGLAVSSLFGVRYTPW